MLLKQQFKTLEGAQKRARFETAHCGRYIYRVVRCVNGEPDKDYFGRYSFNDYTWRLERVTRDD